MMTQTIPDFEWRGFIDAALAFLGSNPLALALVVTGAFIFVCELCFAYAQESARIRSDKRAADRAASVDQAQRDLLRVISRSVWSSTTHVDEIVYPELKSGHIDSGTVRVYGKEKP